MSEHVDDDRAFTSDTPPGEISGQPHGGLLAYSIGLGLAVFLTLASFWTVGVRDLIWPPAVPVVISVLAIAQMGVHLVFFLQITTAPDNTNNVLALAFGVLIVLLLIVGSLWIMANLNHNMLPMSELMKMQR